MQPKHYHMIFLETLNPRRTVTVLMTVVTATLEIISNKKIILTVVKIVITIIFDNCISRIEKKLLFPVLSSYECIRLRKLDDGKGKDSK